MEFETTQGNTSTKIDPKLAFVSSTFTVFYKTAGFQGSVLYLKQVDQLSTDMPVHSKRADGREVEDHI